MTPPCSRLPFLASACLVLIASKALAQEPNTQRWPTSHKPAGKAKIVTVQKGGNGTPYIYHTKNFELRSTEALSQRHLQKFATVAESVPRVLARIPMPLLAMPKSGRAKILIFPDEASFTKAGGPAGAAGYYNGWKEAIMLRADYFLKPPTGGKLPPKPDYALLVHEFVHLCMHRNLAYLPPWFVEGVAEYITAAHVNDGNYRFDNISSRIRARIRYNLANDKEHFTLPGVAETMALTPKTWKERIEIGDPKDFYRPYATSLLLVHSLFHGGQKRRQATRTYLETTRPISLMNQRTETLIPKQQRLKLQQQLAKYWRPRGVRVQFSSP